MQPPWEGDAGAGDTDRGLANRAACSLASWAGTLPATRSRVIREGGMNHR